MEVHARRSSRLFTRKKALLYLGPVAVLLLAGAWLVLRDEPPHDDSDLRDYRRPVKDEENGFRLVDLKEQDVWNDDEEPDLEWHSATFDRARAAELVEKNGAILEKLDRCLALPEFQVDVVEFKRPHPHLAAWRDLSRVLAIRARLHLESGRPGDACEDGLRLVRFGRRIQSSQGTLVVHMRGIHVESLGNVSLVYTAIRGELPIEACRRGIEVLNERLGTARWLQDSLAAEYVGLSETIDDMAEGKIVEGLSSRVFRKPLFKPNETKRLLGEDIGLLVSAASLPHRERAPLDPEKYEVSWLGRFTGAGKLLAGMVVQARESTLTYSDVIRFQGAATLALFALELARADTVALPASLDELVPRYLPSVPLDPFDGKPLRYSASKQVIHSVGTDGKDAAGSDRVDPREAFEHAEEPTLRFSAGAWDLDAMEKSKESGGSANLKRAKKLPSPRTRP